MAEGRMGFRGFVKRRGASFKVLVGLIGPITAVIGTLLALGLIHPLGQENALASAADRTSTARSSEVTLGISMADASSRERIAFTAEGAFDYQTGRGRLVYDFAQTPDLTSLSNVPVIFSQRLLYIKFPQLRERPWVRAVLSQVDKLRRDLAESGNEEMAGDLGFLSQLEFSDPSVALDALKASSDVEEAGDQQLRGMETTVYEGRLDVDSAVTRAVTGDGQGMQSSMPRLAVRAWIDKDERIRQLELFPDDESQSFEMTLGFDNFGVDVEAPPPPPAKVREIGELLSFCCSGPSLDSP